MNKTTIFVDCFNTVILRKKSDQDIIFLWTKEIGKKFEIDPVIIFNLFKKVRKVTLSQILKNRTEVLLTDSIKQIGEILSLNIPDFNQDSFEKFAINSYIETEAKFHYINQDFIVKLREYKSQNKKIYMISDFYCKSEVIQSWLKNLGVDDIFEKIFVSCEYNCAKYNGTLYKYVLKDLNIKAKEAIMFGDNLHSDNVMANLNGIKSKRQKNKQPKNIDTNHIILSNGINFEDFKEIINKNPEETVFSKYSIFYALFCKKLYREIIRTKEKNIFFLSREGQFLKKLFDKYLEIMKKKNILKYEIKTHYLCVSRNSVFNASLQDIDKEQFDLLFCTFKNLSIRNFLTSINFNQEEQEEVRKSLKCSIKKVILNFPKSNKFETLKQDPVFIKIYNKKKSGSNQAFNAYLNSFGVDFQKNGMTIVDSGWNGTIQGLLDNFFEHKVRIKGYYIGCRKAKSKYLRNLDKKGLMFDLVHKNQIGNFKLTYLQLTAEQICGADHARVDSYQLTKDGNFEIVYDNDPEYIKFYKEHLINIQNGIIDNFVKIVNLDYSNLSYLILNANSFLPNIIKNKTKSEKDFEDISLVTYNNGFGNITGNFYEKFGKFSRSSILRILDAFYLLISLFKPSSKKIYKKLIKNK